ncbi:hypothetical protein SCACP_38870 [Sporomusa carbonis]
MNALAEIKRDNEIASDWLLYYPYRRRQYYEDLLDVEYRISDVLNTKRPR